MLLCVGDIFLPENICTLFYHIFKRYASDFYFLIKKYCKASEEVIYLVCIIIS